MASQHSTLDTAAILQFACDLARQGGQVIRDAFYGQGLSVEGQVKNGNPSDLVTLVDQHVETLVFGIIRERYPDHKLIGEESASDSSWTLADDPTWIVDPVDGTTNFTQRFPFVAISIALAYRKELVVGVVYNPVLDELYSARQGHGAWLNQSTRLPFPTGQPAPLPPLNQCLVGFEHGSDRTPAVLDSRLASLRRSGGGEGGAQVRGVRVLGSGALDMCMVARGATDMYWEIGSHLWDIAAGTVIVREAGGIVVNGRGGDNFDILGRKYLAIRAAANDDDAEHSIKHALAREVLTYLEDIEVTRDGI
ncbi:putative inositol-1-monophosphatase [Dimargaris cristalligena]|uniref:Inositol-1-monophosphatase n=1 Tax=Dimargaris cristalligena TaxID=215637 RepID=A0A4V1J549_9FUNG|nr:putative inositol-1-monophosphatase [Dimargaris cristalligena]|eukprot:RKP37819.1 putative inositol-1-monophosphatase [Dimargaris cristalligena]